MPNKTQKPPVVTVNIVKGPASAIRQAAWDRFWKKLLAKAGEGQK